MVLKINNLNKYYNDKKILDNINISLEDNEIISVIGKSGSGKSTLLNIIAGIESKSSGTISKKGEISYMLQEDALMEYMNNLDNALFGLIIKKKLKDENILLAKNYLKKYNLSNYIYKYPNELSGGMRQRVALIRTLINNPKIILLDEPLSKLDYITKLSIEDDIEKEIKEKSRSAIIVTHDIEEAVSMSDKVYYLNNHKIEKEYIIKKDWISPSNARESKLFRKYVKEILGDMKNEKD